MSIKTLAAVEGEVVEVAVAVEGVEEVAVAVEMEGVEEVEEEGVEVEEEEEEAEEEGEVCSAGNPSGSTSSSFSTQEGERGQGAWEKSFSME